MNNNWEFDYSELYNNNNPGRNAQNTAAPEAESPLQGAPGPAGMPGMGVGGAPVPPHAAQKKRGWGKRVAAGAAPQAPSVIRRPRPRPAQAAPRAARPTQPTRFPSQKSPAR